LADVVAGELHLPLVTVIGEALIDLAPNGTPHEFRALPGGSPFNVAVGLARLDIPTALMARLADNAFGRLLRAHALGEGIDLTSAPSAHEPTTLAVVSVDADARAQYDFYLEGTADWQWTADEARRLPQGTAALHFGSIASWTEPGSSHIHDLISGLHQRGEVLISYDPNVRPQLMGTPKTARQLVERSVSIAHVVKASREDLDWLYPNLSIHRVAERWTEIGANLVIVTDGAHGAYGYRPGRARLHRPGRNVTVTDTIGAGDSFTAGLLSGLVRHDLHTPRRIRDCSTRALQEILSEAVLVSSITCERSGANPPRRADYSGSSGVHAT